MARDAPKPNTPDPIMGTIQWTDALADHPNHLKMGESHWLLFGEWITGEVLLTTDQLERRMSQGSMEGFGIPVFGLRCYVQSAGY